MIKAIFLTFLIATASGETSKADIETNWMNYNTEFKAYMHYSSITDRTSEQYKLQEVAYTENCLRKIDDKYMVAVGTGFDVFVGDEIVVVLDTGEKIECIVGDIKQNIHTDNTNTFKILLFNGVPVVGEDGRVMANVVEFIVGDVDETMRRTGDVSHLDNLEGNIKDIIKEGEVHL